MFGPRCQSISLRQHDDDDDELDDDDDEGMCRPRSVLNRVKLVVIKYKI